jgi:hypothetical protein
MEYDHYLFQLCPFRNATQFALKRALNEVESRELLAPASTSMIQPPWHLITNSFSLGYWVSILPDDNVDQTASQTPSIKSFRKNLPPQRPDAEKATSKNAKAVLSWRDLALTPPVASTRPSSFPFVAPALPFSAALASLQRQSNTSAARVSALQSLAPLLEGQLNTRSRLVNSVEYLGSRVFTQWFGAGLQCWNGPPRSALVKVFCGVDTRLVAVQENGRCSYEFEMSTPLACAPADLALLRELRSVAAAVLV